MRKPPPGAVLAVLAAGQFTVMLATSIVNVALPQIRDGVGLSEAATTGGSTPTAWPSGRCCWPAGAPPTCWAGAGSCSSV